MFQRPLEVSRETVTIVFEGIPISVPVGETVANALIIANVGPTRTTPVSGAPRSAYCLMGVCFECLVVIDGKPDQQSCMVVVREGMTVQSQQGATDVTDVMDVIAGEVAT